MMRATLVKRRIPISVTPRISSPVESHDRSAQQWLNSSYQKRETTRAR
jgi:hypothetical protein